VGLLPLCSVTVFEGEFAEKRFWGFLEGRLDLVTLSLAGSNVRKQHLPDLELFYTEALEQR
jgi:hypothetical protein